MTGILLSGGIDSAALAFWKRPDIAININYGQRSAIAERQASLSIAKELNIPLQTIDIDCSSLGSGDLSNNHAIEIAPVSEWWPYRNQLLITLASMRAVSVGIKELMIGAVVTDKRHLDGTEDFFKLMNLTTNYQEGHLEITVPGITMDTLQLIKTANVPNSILGWTHSCHTGNLPCGQCNGCNKHLFVKTKLNLI